MRAGVSVNNGQAFGLAHALLVYTDGRRSFVTMHDPVEANGAAPTLGPGRLISTAFLRELSKQLGASVSADILPENVLVRTAEVTVWWRRASVETLFYNPAKDAQHAKDLKTLNGTRVAIPPLVFRATKQQLWVRSLARNERPKADSHLFAAPFYNVSAKGGVCLGSMRRPHGRGLDTLAQWERSFFESEFTHILPGVTASRHPKGLIAMWLAIAATTKANASFPAKWLAPVAQTLSRFATDNEVGRL